MLRRDYRDIAGGLLLVVVGISIALYTLSQYDLGTFRQMGSGMFPLMMAILLACLGILVILPALLQEGSHRRFEPKSFAAVTCSLVAFPLLLAYAGLVPAVIVSTVIAGLADSGSTLRGKLTLGVVLSALSYGVFVLGLGLPLVAFGRAI